MSRLQHHLELFAPEPRAAGGRLLSILGPVVVLAMVILLGGLAQYAKEGHTSYLSPNNQTLVLRQTAMVAVAAVGMTMIIISGGIDLSVGSVVALTAVTAAYVVDALGPRGAAALAGAQAVYLPVLALAAAVAMGAAVGTVNGTVITRLRLPPFIATLGMMALARGGAKWLAANQKIDAPGTWISGLTNPNLPLFGTDLPEPPLRWTGEAALSGAVLVALVLAAAVAVALRSTRFGRHLFAIGSSEATARLCGVPVERTKVAIYTLAGALFGLAGALTMGYNSVGDPSGAVGMELEVIAAVVIGGGSLSGGSGSVLGTIIGALLMEHLRNLCHVLDLQDYVSDMVVGVVIVGAVTVDRYRHRRAG